MRLIAVNFIGAVGAVGAVALATACPTSETKTTTAPVAPAPIAPRVEGPLGPLLEAYDETQRGLAADDLPTAQQAAAKLSTAAAAAGKADIVTAADRIKAAPDIAAARLALGDASRSIIIIISADPALQQGRYLFACPMVKGYQRWVQTSTQLRNPYFGKEMLECGEQLKTWGA